MTEEGATTRPSDLTRAGSADGGQASRHRGIDWTRNSPRRASKALSFVSGAFRVFYGP